MLSLAFLMWAIFCCILGSMIIIWPDKTKRKLGQASNSTIRWWGVFIFDTGVWLAIAVWLFNRALALLNSLGK
jgi:hypothetical protein